MRIKNILIVTLDLIIKKLILLADLENHVAQLKNKSLLQEER